MSLPRSLLPSLQAPKDKSHIPYTAQIFGGTLKATPRAKSSPTEKQTWLVDWTGPQGSSLQFKVQLAGQFGARQLENDTYSKQKIAEVIQSHAPQEIIFKAARESARRQNQPVRVILPVDGPTYHAFKGSVPSPMNPRLDVFMINAPAEIKKPGKHKPSIGQALADVGLQPVWTNGGGGAIYLVPNDKNGAALYAKALFQAVAQPLFGLDRSLIPRGASAEFIQGLGDAYRGQTALNVLFGVNQGVSVMGGLGGPAAKFVAGRNIRKLPWDGRQKIDPKTVTINVPVISKEIIPNPPSKTKIVKTPQKSANNSLSLRISSSSLSMKGPDGKALNLNTSPKNLASEIDRYLNPLSTTQKVIAISKIAEYLKSNNPNLYQNQEIKNVLNKHLDQKQTSLEITSTAKIPVVLASINQNSTPGKTAITPAEKNIKMLPGSKNTTNWAPKKPILPGINISNNDLFSLWESGFVGSQIKLDDSILRPLIQSFILLGPEKGRKWANDSSIQGPINRLDENVVSALAEAINQISPADLSRLGAKTLEKLRIDVVYKKSLEEYTLGTKNRQAGSADPAYIPAYADPFQRAIYQLTQAESLAKNNNNKITSSKPTKKPPANTAPTLLKPGETIPPTLYTPIGLKTNQHVYYLPDVHGNYDLLRACIIFIAKQIKLLGIKNLSIINGGDLFNKGWNPKGVVDLAKKLKEISTSKPNEINISYPSDPDLEHALKTLQRLRFRFVALRGNHEEFSNYLLPAIKNTPNKPYSQKTGEMFGKGFDHTLISYINQVPLSDPDKNFMRSFLEAYPVWDNKKKSWQWAGPKKDSKTTAPSDQAANQSLNEFKRIWIDGLLVKTGHFDFLQGLSPAYQLPYEGGTALFTHGGFPSNSRQLQALVKHLNDGTPLPDPVLRQILWARGLTNKNLIAEINQIPNNPYGPSVHGHTMSGAPVFSQTDNSDHTYKRIISLDLGFGTNSLGMLHIQPDGSAVFIIAKRSSQGLIYEAVPLSQSAQVGIKELPNRFKD